MTYATGGPIQALDYNTFSTLVGGMNQVYSDLYPGTVPLTLGTYNPTDPCTYGYGRTPSLSTVLVGAPVQASEWAALFDTMRASGTHQGTTVSPPLPVADPVAGNVVTAHNTPATFSSVVTSLITNRFNLALGQSTLVSGAAQTQSSGSWKSKLTFTCQVNFGSWDNARYFFNTGGYLSFTGSYTPTSSPEDVMWNTLLSNMSAPTVMNYFTTTNTIGGAVPNVGFYSLTNSYKILYHGVPTSGPYYAGSSITVSAKYASAGASGLVDLKFEMDDLDALPNTKTGITTFHINTLRSTDAVVIALPTIINPVFTSTM